MSRPDPKRLLAAALTGGVLALLGCGQKPASVDVSPRKIVIYGVGRGKDLTVHVLDKKGGVLTDDLPLAFSASPAGVVDATSSGHLTGRKPGKATITVTAGELSATVPVEVRDVAFIDIVPATVRLIGPSGTQSKLEITGKTADGQPAAVGAVGWTSKDPRVAVVAADGVVSSVQAGKTSIVAKLGDLSTETDVEVGIKNISRLEIRPETAIVKVGESERFSVLAYDEAGLLIADAAAQFSTLNTALVTVSGNGKATGVSRGTAVVIATIGDKSARATLLVN